MSFQAFLSDPKSYLKVHRMQLAGEGSGLWTLGGTAMTRAVPVANAAQGMSIQFTHVSNVEMVTTANAGPRNGAAMALGRMGLMDKRSAQYSPRPGGAFADLRILPWSAANVTFMLLDGAADFAITGPLQGCTLAVVRRPTGIYFFHANVSGAGGVNNANRATKRAMIQNAGLLAGIPAHANYANYAYCEYGPAHQYHGEGFVWGRTRGAGNWKFYVHEVKEAQGMLDIKPTQDGKWADL